MLRDVTKNKTDYSVLAVIASAFIMYFLSIRHNPKLLVVATFVFAGMYVVWGIWHHLRTQSLTRHIVLEYVLVSILGVVIVSSLLI